VDNNADEKSKFMVKYQTIMNDLLMENAWAEQQMCTNKEEQSRMEVQSKLNQKHQKHKVKKFCIDHANDPLAEPWIPVRRAQCTSLSFAQKGSKRNR